jgi:hypothetical protein
MKRFSGIFTPIVTPFDAGDAVDEAALRRNVAQWMRTPLTGLVVLGSNGEAAQLDDDRGIARCSPGPAANRPGRRLRRRAAPRPRASTPSWCAPRRSSRRR